MTQKETGKVRKVAGKYLAITPSKWIKALSSQSRVEQSRSEDANGN